MREPSHAKPHLDFFLLLCYNQYVFNLKKESEIQNENDCDHR